MTEPLRLEHAGGLSLYQALITMQDRILSGTTYFGIPTLKNPIDFWVYQELIWERRPDVVVEIGNNRGGSALALAHVLDHVGHGRLIGVDIDQSRLDPRARAHPRIEFLEGDGVARVGEVRARIAAPERAMVIEDSSHTYDNTLAVLRAYASLVHPGDYFIVEDSICHHGLDVGPAPGPFEAIEAFLAESDAFESDRTREGFLITWNPKGFLRRR